MRKYRHLKFFQHGGGRHLGFVRTVNSAVRSAVPETYPRTKHEVDHPLQRYGHSRMLGTYGTPILGEGEVVGGQRWHHSKERWWYPRLSIVTVALYVTIRPQLAIECLQHSNQQGVGDFGPKFRGVPLGADPSCSGCTERTSQQAN